MSEEIKIDSDESLIQALEYVGSYVDIHSVKAVCDLAAKRIRSLKGDCTHRWYLIVHSGLYRHQCHDCGHNIGQNEMLLLIKRGDVNHDQMEMVTVK